MFPPLQTFAAPEPRLMLFRHAFANPPGGGRIHLRAVSLDGRKYSPTPGSQGGRACSDKSFYRQRAAIHGHGPLLYRHLGIEPTPMSFNSKLERNERN